MDRKEFHIEKIGIGERRKLYVKYLGSSTWFLIHQGNLNTLEEFIKFLKRIGFKENNQVKM